MRSDLFQDRKCVHVKLSKEVHAALRAELFRRDLSMQEIFDDFANYIAMSDNRALRFLERLSMKKLQAKIDGISHRGTRAMGELDADTVYDLIAGTDFNRDEDDAEEMT